MTLPIKVGAILVFRAEPQARHSFNRRDRVWNSITLAIHGRLNFRVNQYNSDTVFDILVSTTIPNGGPGRSRTYDVSYVSDLQSDALAN